MSEERGEEGIRMSNFKEDILEDVGNELNTAIIIVTSNYDANKKIKPGN